MPRRPAPELSGRPRRRLVEQVRREEPNCHLCGKPIDLALAPTHAKSSTVDELVPRSKVLDPRRAALTRSGVAHAHRDCNSRKGNRDTVPRRSRVW